MGIGEEQDRWSRRRRVSSARFLADAAIAGLAGALASSIPHTALDLIAGEPLHTPLVLYDAVVHGSASPAVEALLFTGLHLAVWCGIGLVLAATIALVDLRPSFGPSAVFLALLGFCTAMSVATALSGRTALATPVWIGTATGAVAAIGTLILRHRSVLDFEGWRMLTPSTRSDLDLAHVEEHRCLEFLRAARKAHPRVEWLGGLEAQAERNVAQVDALFARFGLRAPEPEGEAADSPSDALIEIEAAVARQNAGRRALYDRFLVVVDEPLVRALFERLRFAADRAIREAAPRPGGAPWRVSDGSTPESNGSHSERA